MTSNVRDLLDQTVITRETPFKVMRIFRVQTFARSCVETWNFVNISSLTWKLENVKLSTAEKGAVIF